ncbi:unnamed protein product [Trichobilharzia regenti]|nr:unnamed protein product [Trichobilharzia regenti]
MSCNECTDTDEKQGNLKPIVRIILTHPEKKSSSQRVSPRTTPYLNAPTATTGLPLSIQAQIQQGQLVKADQPQRKGTSVPPTTPRISISKSKLYVIWKK